MGPHRVRRGGSWNLSAGDCRSALRNNIDPGFRYFFLGLRLVVRRTNDNDNNVECPYCGRSYVIDKKRNGGNSMNQETKQEKYICPVTGMAFVEIPAGKFMMGSPEGVGYSDEHPQHEVVIPKPFFMGICQVTQGEWQKVMGSNPSHFTGDPRLPVESVSWNDCQKFIEKLNALNPEYEYSLPSEEQWEYACRAGSTTKYFFGDEPDMLGEYAWFWENSGSKTHPVGQKKPNPWGLFDILGNVWEWCKDQYKRYEDKVN